MAIFDSAVRGKDGSVDPGYLALYWSLIGWSISSGLIFLMGFIALYKCTPEEVGSVVQNVGVAEGAVAAAFATVVGAVGLFRAGDKDRPVPGTTTTKTESKVEIVTPPPNPVEGTQHEPPLPILVS